MTTLTAHGRTVSSFEELVNQLGTDAFASPKRSTVPLLDYWRVPDPRLRDMTGRLGMPWSERFELHFEYEVPVRRGRGKSSYTDLMILADDVAVAIEAKFTEPRYESVGNWLGPEQATNRADVLNGWIGAIEGVTGGAINREIVRQLPYQVIHRTASVCCVNSPKRVVVYQVFGHAPEPYYADDLGRLVSAMAARDRVMFFVVSNSFRRTATYAQLVARWDAGEREMGTDVRDALIAGPLLEFDEPVAISISGAA